MPPKRKGKTKASKGRYVDPSFIFRVVPDDKLIGPPDDMISKRPPKREPPKFIKNSVFRYVHHSVWETLIAWWCVEYMGRTLCLLHETCVGCPFGRDREMTLPTGTVLVCPGEHEPIEMTEPDFRDWISGPLELHPDDINESEINYDQIWEKLYKDSVHTLLENVKKTSERFCFAKKGSTGNSTSTCSSGLESPALKNPLRRVLRKHINLIIIKLQQMFTTVFTVVR